MNALKKPGESMVYRQEDGEVTARFSRVEVRQRLAHEGSVFYRKVFFLLMAAGAIYLGLVFFLVSHP